MHKILMTVRTFFLIPRPCVKHAPVGKHGPTFLAEIQKVLMTRHTIVVLDAFVGSQPVFMTVIFTTEKMSEHILEAVNRFSIKKVHRIFRLWQVAVLTLSNYTFGVAGMA